jgi:hypothetical protein
MKLKYPLLILFLAGSLMLPAQEPVPKDTFDITKHTMQFPHPYKQWGFKISAGLCMVRPPKDLLENAIQAPLVNIHMIFGLPYHFSLESELTTIVVSNQLTLGPRYSFLYKNFGVKAGWDIAFIYGQLRQGGFDNSLTAWVNYPNLSVGYKLKKMSFTLKGEMVIVTKSASKSGENEVDHSKNFINGGTVAFYLEQRIHHNKVFIIGIKDNYEKLYWPTWMIYSTFNRYYHIPELNFSWIL